MKIMLIILLINFNLFALNLNNGSATLMGQIVSNKCQGPFQLWISKGKTLIYQAEAPRNGTFEFHLFAGSYDVAVTSTDKCVIKEKIKVTKNKTKKIVLRLK